MGLQTNDPIGTMPTPTMTCDCKMTIRYGTKIIATPLSIFVRNLNIIYSLAHVLDAF